MRQSYELHSEEVLLGDAYRIGIGGAGVTGEKEEVLGDDM